MKKLWMISLSWLLLSSSMGEEPVYITIGADAVDSAMKSFVVSKPIKTQNKISLLKLDPKQIVNLSKQMHENFNRCGGFIVHESKKEAMDVLTNESNRLKAKHISTMRYSITEEQAVQSMISKVKEINIRDMIIKLSSFKNRYYRSQSGIDSQKFVAKVWQDIASSRSDMRVESFNHSSWPQPTVILTIDGKSKKEEVVILGGHADSIAGWFGRENARAPGADDNASGIATITEVIRVIAESGYSPERTVKFMAYAAEEVGLLGSKAIANQYRTENKNVVGVVQFDMTNYKGSKDLDIVFMTDYTNEAQNKFMGSLIDYYMTNVRWGYSQCGYGCSDHASWHNAGFPASMPFESIKGDMNGHIHTKRDTIDVARSGGTADHAEKFARLGIAYIVEMGK